MFFTLSKLAALAFIHPANTILLALISGLLLGLTRFVRAGRLLIVAAVIAFAIVGVSPLASLPLRPLEDRFALPPADLPAPTGIIVLGGALDEDIGAARGQPTLTEAAARLTSGVAPARRFPQALLVFTGGSGGLEETGLDEARGVRALWLSLGVPAAQMRFKSRSRNTYENAVMTRDLIRPTPGQGWLLVTSAAHMPRAVGLFRAAGWPVIAYPVDSRTFGDRRDALPSAQVLNSLLRLDAAMHEWVGLLAYGATGKITSLFPGP